MKILTYTIRRMSFQRMVPVIVIFVLSSITSITWFDNGYFIMRSDMFPQLNAVQWFKNQALFIWGDYSHVLMASDAANLPFMGFWASLLSIGIQPLVVQRLWWFFILLFTGLSAYYLGSVFIHGRLGRIVACVFYMFNLFSLVEYGLEPSAVGYAALPLLLGLLWTGLERKENRYVFLFAITSLLTTSLAVNFSVFAITWIIVAFFFIYRLIFIEEKKISALFFFSKMILLYLMVNAFWMVGLGASLTSGNVTIQSKISITEAALNCQISNILNVLRLGPISYIYFDPSGGYPFATSYSTPILIITTLLIPILAFSALIVRPRNRNVFFLSIGAILFVLLAKGTHSPLGFINYFLYSHIPGFVIFREPWKNFDQGIVLFWALLMGYATNEIVRRIGTTRITNLGNAARKILICLFLSLVFFSIFASAWPLVTGAHFTRTGTAPHHAKIPSYWFEANEWFNDQSGDFRIILTPRDTHFSHYYWETPLGTNGTRLVNGREKILIDKPLLFNQPIPLYYSWGQMSHMVKIFYDTMRLNTTKLSNLLSLLKVKYILQRNDLDWTYYNSTDLGSPEFIKGVLEKQEGIAFKRSFGGLDIYEVENKYLPPLIYGSSKVVDLSNVHVEKPYGIGWEDEEILFSTPPFQETNATVITDDEQTSFWTSFAETEGGLIGAPNLTEDTLEKAEGADSLKMVIGSGTYYFWGIKHTYDILQDWGSQDVICLYWYGENSGKHFAIRIAAPDWSNWYRRDFEENFAGWKRLVIPLNAFDVEAGSPSWSTVKEIRIGTYPWDSKNLSGIWHLDRVILDVGWEKLKVWVDTNDQVPMNISNLNSTAYITLPSSSSYIYGCIKSPGLKINASEYPYLFVRFKTNRYTDIALHIATQGEPTVHPWIYPLNPPPYLSQIRQHQNHIQSLDWYILVYKLEFKQLITGIDIYITNWYEPNFDGTLEAWIDSVAFAKEPGFYELTEFDQKLLTALFSGEFEPGRTVLAFDASNLENSLVNQSYAPTITFHKVSPSEYKVHVVTQQPFLLVFSETYHPDWKIYQKGMHWIETFWKQPIVSDSQHLLVNGYANAWYINITGSYDITIYFQRQALYNVGWITTALTTTTCVAFLLWGIAKNHLSERPRLARLKRLLKMA